MIFILRSGGCGGTISPEGGVRSVQKKQKATKKPSKDEQKAKKPKPPAEINTTRFPDERYDQTAADRPTGAHGSRQRPPTLDRRREAVGTSRTKLSCRSVPTCEGCRADQHDHRHCIHVLRPKSSSDPRAHGSMNFDLRALGFMSQRPGSSQRAHGSPT